MADAKRPPQETKEIGIKKLIDSYEKNNRTACPSEQKRVFEKLYNEKVLPAVYGK